jgi:hypothetical protein
VVDSLQRSDERRNAMFSSIKRNRGGFVGLSGRQTSKPLRVLNLRRDRFDFMEKPVLEDTKVGENKVKPGAETARLAEVVS